MTQQYNTVSEKTTTLHSWLQLHQILIDFQNSSTSRFGSKLRTRVQHIFLTHSVYAGT